MCALLPILEKELRRRGKKKRKKVAGRGQSSCLLASGFAREIMFKELVHTTIFMGGSRYSTIP